MQTSQEVTTRKGSHQARRVAVGSFLGTAAEWYDYFIYGSAAALVFGPLFFPGYSASAGTLAAFATYSVGFLARPLGGVIMGHLGDRIGRKKMLVASLLIAGLATFCIGLLPTYSAIGVWAPILLVSLRFIQGMGVGGEWGAAVLMATEHAPRARRNFYGSFPQMGVPAGIILANLAFLAVSQLLSNDAFRAWGWRIPFLLSALLVVLGLVIRLRIEESPEFEQIRRSGQRSRVPVLEVIRTHRRQIVLAVGSFVGQNTLGYILVAYILSYATGNLGLSRNMMLSFTMISALVWLAAIGAASVLSDRIGRPRVLIWGSVGLLLTAAGMFAALDTANAGVVLLTMVVLATMLGVTYGPLAAMFADLFVPRLRYSGTSISYQLGSVLGGGLAPTLATALFASWNSSLPVSLYVAGTAVVSLVSIVLVTRDRFAPATTAGTA